MATREGSLEAPKRHPIDWRSPAFYAEDALEKELGRVFDICHGCRRCVNLCGAFPTLFDLVDHASSGEVDTVSKSDFGKVVDDCYLCDLCFMTKCPYVPPHPWNVDFPHLMLRAKAVEFRRTGGRTRDRILSSTDSAGRLAGIPVVTRTVNAINRTAPARRALEATLQVDRNAWRPEFAL
ncbi:MAG TPA: Fe-S oxidoreductase, partial [Burkholderiaceae bacterium]|nr:Fe-S oxidoreductase [Burkholderiaceae bacterium]